jgi:hypothetical protein
VIEFTLKTKEKLVIFPDLGISVHVDKQENCVRLENGHHNNGGWKIDEPLEDVLFKLRMASLELERRDQ